MVKIYYFLIFVILVIVVLSGKVKMDQFHYETDFNDDGGDSYESLTSPLATAISTDDSSVEIVNNYRVYVKDGVHLLVGSNSTLVTFDYTGTVKMVLNVEYCDGTMNQLNFEKTELGRVHRIDGNLQSLEIMIDPISDESKALVEIDNADAIVEKESANTIKAKKSGILECCDEYGTVIDSLIVKKGCEYVINKKVDLLTIY